MSLTAPSMFLLTGLDCGHGGRVAPSVVELEAIEEAAAIRERARLLAAAEAYHGSQHHRFGWGECPVTKCYGIQLIAMDGWYRRADYPRPDEDGAL